MSLFRSVYSGKTVLVTGHTGFKGGWLTIWLRSQGADVVGLSLDVPGSPSFFVEAQLDQYMEDFRIDIRNADAVRQLVNDIQPDYIFHLAAQALVKTSYSDPLRTFSTNAMGTVNILDSLRSLRKDVVVILITSDKAYDNLEWVWGYRETDKLGGIDPYSASKGMAELAIRSYIRSFFNRDTNVRIGVARAGNVIGGGDWASDRIVPDCMKAWSENQVVDIRSPGATRPWQHVLEPLSGYLSLGAVLSLNSDLHGEAYNFGPSAQQNHTVGDLIDEMNKYWDSVRWADVSNSQPHPHEAGLLKLNCDKALSDLEWQPTLNFKETVKMTVEWYKNYYQREASHNSAALLEYSSEQIDEYVNYAIERNMAWTQ